MPPLASAGQDWPLSAQVTWLVAGGGPTTPGDACLLSQEADLGGGGRPRRRRGAEASAGLGRWEQQPATIPSNKSWHPPSAQVLLPSWASAQGAGSGCQRLALVLQCRVLSLQPPPPLHLPAKECALALRLQLGYCLWLPALCRKKGR